jgi:hypothetical protein
MVKIDPGVKDYMFVEMICFWQEQFGKYSSESLTKYAKAFLIYLQ